MGTSKGQVVDPKVSKIKFKREVAEFRAIENDWRKKGVICLKIKFPIVQLVFLAHQH